MKVKITWDSCGRLIGRYCVFVHSTNLPLVKEFNPFTFKFLTGKGLWIPFCLLFSVFSCFHPPFSSFLSAFVPNWFSRSDSLVIFSVCVQAIDIFVVTVRITQHILNLNNFFNTFLFLFYYSCPNFPRLLSPDPAPPPPANPHTVVHVYGSLIFVL